jgi:DNA-binding Xre family transcriptional regulator
MNKHLRTNLSYLRFTHGRLSQKTVSEGTGIGQKTLSALETGASRGIEFNTLLRLCTFFNCTPGELLIIEEEPEEIEVSAQSREKAKVLVARGLKEAMEAAPQTPEQIWDEFDAARARIQESADRAANTGRRSTNRA